MVEERDDRAAPGRVRIHVDGAPLDVPSGTSLAAALAARGSLALSHSVGGEPRGPLCGMGTCFECRVAVDGRAHVRACITPCRAGMRVETRRA